MSFEEGALLEPLSVGLHAVRRGRIRPEDRVLVLGLGPIGLFAMEAAKMSGASQVYGATSWNTGVIWPCRWEPPA